LSHDNDGSGFGLFEYAGIPAAHDNVVRYNVSRDDGRKNAYAGIHLWNGGAALEHVEVHNNEVTLSAATGVAGAPPRLSPRRSPGRCSSPMPTRTVPASICISVAADR
ncbi:MAG: hypothetical protein ACJ79D_05330, partial [Myxococcales bacterium]